MKPTGRRVKTISICLPDDLCEELRHNAWAVGISVSSYITMLLSEAVRQIHKREEYAKED